MLSLYLALSYVSVVMLDDSCYMLLPQGIETGTFQGCVSEQGCVPFQEVVSSFLYLMTGLV